MIIAQNDSFELQLGMNENDYLDTINETITDDETRNKFIDNYKKLSRQEKEIIRTFVPLSLIDDEDNNIKFLFAIRAINSSEVENTVNRFKEIMKEK